uniref:L-serine ammonia-lyase n=1 Tax=Ciona intestinalis TaxID=7719 RepID=F6VCE5_CIOIN
LFAMNNSNSKFTTNNSHCIDFNDVKAAYEIIKPFIHQTPLMQCSAISELAGCNVFLKTENFQKTGSFKIRGATNALSHSVKEDAIQCVITRSSGNHGQAIAYVAKSMGIPAYIIMSNTALKCKKDAIRSYGGIIVEGKPQLEHRKKITEHLLKEKGGIFIHSGQNPHVIAGQGTLAMEMLEQNPNLDAIVAPVGGGGLISGVAIAAKALKPYIKIYAVEPENANGCYLSKLSGKLEYVVGTEATIADGVRANIGESTWPIIQDLIDDVITVSEEEIKQATVLVWERAKLVIEPTAGVGVAAVVGKKLLSAKGFDNSVKNIGLVLSGGNVDARDIAKLIANA